MNSSGLPLEGIKVVEFTHMVMGPTVGVILADLGAQVIKIEPLKKNVPAIQAVMRQYPAP